MQLAKTAVRLAQRDAGLASLADVASAVVVGTAVAATMEV